MSRAAARKPHARAAEKRIGRAAVDGDPWAADIRKKLLYAAHEAQRGAMVDPSRRISILTGRGGGKTTTLKGRYLIDMSATTGGKYIYACPTLGMAIDLLWEPLKQTCEQLGIMDECEWKEAPREGGKILTIKRTGSRLKLFGADDKKQINLCRGQPFDGVGCDEVGFWPNPEIVANFVEKVIEPRIGERAGWIALASSPGHNLRGLFFDVTKDGGDHRPYAKRGDFAGWSPVRWSSHAWSLRDVVEEKNAGKRYPALIALRRSHLEIKRERGWSDENPTWMREYEGRWAADGTTMVFRFDASRNLWAPQRWDEQAKAFETKGPLPTIEGIELLKRALAALPTGEQGSGEWKFKLEWRHVLIVDKGSPRVAKADEQGEKKRDGDPYAVNVLSFAPADPLRRIFHTFCLEKHGLYARPIAQLLRGADENGPNGCMPITKPGGVLGLIGWPDAMVMDGDQSTIEELSNVYSLRFEKAEKKPDYKFGAIELTNSDLVDGRILIIEDSAMHRQITGLQWAEQDSGALKEDPSQPNHSSDCLLYGRKKIAALFLSGVATQEDAGDRGETRARPAATGYSDPMGLDGGSGVDDAFDSWMGNSNEWGL